MGSQGAPPAGQLTLDVPPACKERDCTEPVVGSSITGEGHVCKRHNTAEWGASLARSKDPYYRGLGAALTTEAAA